MAKIKLTKTVVDAVQPQTTDVELRDTLVPGFLCAKCPPEAGRLSWFSIAPTLASAASHRSGCSAS